MAVLKMVLCCFVVVWRQRSDFYDEGVEFLTVTVLAAAHAPTIISAHSPDTPLPRRGSTFGRNGGALKVHSQVSVAVVGLVTI